jgi:drug/metabolite transporter (DMT)-like permease
METTKKTSAVLSMLLVMLIWGSTFAITRTAVSKVPPATYALLRFVVASISIGIIYLLKRRQFNPTERVPAAPVFWMGLCGIGSFYLFFNYALLYTSASMGAMIQAFIPVAISLLAVIFLGERLTGVQRWGIVFSVAGVILITMLNPHDQTLKNPLLGNILMMLSVISWAVYTIISKRLSGNNVIKVTAYSTWIGTAFLIPASVIELWGQPFPVISPPVWGSVLFLGAAASALCYLLYNSSLKILPASTVGVFINLDPVVGALIAVVFLNEKISVWQLTGAVLVIAGMWLSTKKDKKPVA